MNLIYSTDSKYYFYVMAAEAIILSVFYWIFFSLSFASVATYILSVIFYITGYLLWKHIRQQNEHLLFNPLEHYLIINIITLLCIFTINSFFNRDILLLIPIYLLLVFIFISYYVFRLKKQEKSIVPIPIISSYTKALIVMNIVFLLFDLIVYLCNRLQIQLILYMPILFAIFTFLLSIYKKQLSFKSLMSFVLFFNVYIISSLLLVLNYIHYNFFTFLVIIHSVLFFATVCLFRINSVETDEKYFYYNYNLFSLIFANVIISFISLNNILSFNMPNMFTSYLYFSVLAVITYLVYSIYKITSKV